MSPHGIMGPPDEMKVHQICGTSVDWPDP